MSIFIYLSFLSIFVTVSLGNSVTQTDWSGGLSPFWSVLSWEDEFNSSENLEWSAFPGEVSLLLSIEDHFVIGTWRPNDLQAKDMDQDGDMDILVSSLIGDYICWIDNEGYGNTWTERIVSDSFDGASSSFSEDIDGDGDFDIVASAYYGNAIAWWSNYDGSGYIWIKHNIDINYEGAGGVIAADIDDDGDMDIVGTGAGINHVSWWENINGVGTSWLEHTIDDSFTFAYSVCVDDFDNDGDIDVAAASFSPGIIACWSNEDFGDSWQKTIVDSDLEDIACVRSSDIDGDGDIDILGASPTDDEIAWWENADGSGTIWTKVLVATEVDGAWSVAPVDIDKDGDVDIIVAAEYAGKIVLYENSNGIATNWVEHLVESDYSSPRSVCSGDLNSDGYDDIIGAAVTDDVIKWWDYTGYPANGSLTSSCLYLENDPGWGSIDWVSEETEDTSVLLQVRSSDSPDSSSMGEWSDTLSSPGSLFGILDEGDSFMQYKVLFGTNNPYSTASLDEITVYWNPVSVSNQNEPLASTISLLPFVPNPSLSAMVKFTLPESGTVNILIYDLAGRLITDNTMDNCDSGINEVPLQGLTPGIYFCKLSSGAYLGIQSFVIIE